MGDEFHYCPFIILWGWLNTHHDALVNVSLKTCMGVQLGQVEAIMEQRRQEAGQRAMDSLQGLASGHPSSEATLMANGSPSSSVVRRQAILCTAVCQDLHGNYWRVPTDLAAKP